MAISLKDLHATINANEDTKKFAAHFQYKASVKNIVKAIERDDRFKNHGKVIAEGITGKVGEIVMAKIVDHYIVALNSAFADFTTQNTEWKTTGKTKALPVRVEFLLDKIMEHVNKNPEDDKKIGDALTLIDGEKEVIDLRQALIADGFDEASEPLHELMVDIMLYSAGRLLINEAVQYVEPVIPHVEGEVVTDDPVDGAAHKKDKDSSTGADTTADATGTKDTGADATTTDPGKETYEVILSKLADKNSNASAEETTSRIFSLVDQLKDAPEDRVEHAGRILQSSIPKDMLGGIIKSFVTKKTTNALTDEQKESRDCHKDIFQGLLPDVYKNDAIINTLVDFTSTMMSGITDEDFETRLELIHKTYAIATQFIYTMIAGVVGTGTDTINLFRMCKECTNFAATADDGDYGFDALMKIFDKDKLMELPKFIERINCVIRTNRTAEYATGEEYARVMQIHRSKRVIQNGLDAIKKAA